jgi:AraC-like DNA-binding protein
MFDQRGRRQALAPCPGVSEGCPIVWLAWTTLGKRAKLGQMAAPPVRPDGSEDVLELRVVLEGKTLVFRYADERSPMVRSVRDALARGAENEPLLRRLSDALLSAVSRACVPTIDPRIGKTLAALHERFFERWTLAKMAKLAGMSRAAFAARFKQVTGASPGAYLARLRLHAARDLLIETDDPAAKIAFQVGYQSAYAFSRAFRRMMGRPPVLYRKAMRAVPARIECRAASIRLAA